MEAFKADIRIGTCLLIPFYTVHDAHDLCDQELFKRLSLSMELFGAKARQPLQVVQRPLEPRQLSQVGNAEQFPLRLVADPLHSQSNRYNTSNTLRTAMTEPTITCPKCKTEI